MKDKDKDIVLMPEGDNLNKWIAKIKGAVDTPYQEGKIISNLINKI